MGIRLTQRYLLVAALAAAGYAHAEGSFSPSGLNLSLPKEVLSPIPIYIIIQNRPDTLPSVREYAGNVIRLIDAQVDEKPMLDRDGKRICTDRAYDYLIVLDKAGKLIDIKTMPEQLNDPRALREITLDRVLEIARSVSPFPPFPEAERLGSRLVGIPSKLDIHCKSNSWVRSTKPPRSVMETGSK